MPLLGRTNEAQMKVAKIFFARHFGVTEESMAIALGPLPTGIVNMRRASLNNNSTTWRAMAFGRNSFLFAFVEHTVTLHDFMVGLTNCTRDYADVIQRSRARVRDEEAQEDYDEKARLLKAYLDRQHRNLELSLDKYEATNAVELASAELVTGGNYHHRVRLEQLRDEKVHLASVHEVILANAAKIRAEEKARNTNKVRMQRLAKLHHLVRQKWWERKFEDHYEAVARSVLNGVKTYIAVEETIATKEFRHILEYVFCSMAEIYYSVIIGPVTAVLYAKALLKSKGVVCGHIEIDAAANMDIVFRRLDAVGHAYPKLGYDMIKVPMQNLSKRELDDEDYLMDETVRQKEFR